MPTIAHTYIWMTKLQRFEEHKPPQSNEEDFGPFEER